jgi:GMP synthase (glutamine-hydrolysing)
MKISKSVTAFRHVHFEDLGSFSAALEGCEYGVTYCDIGIDPLGRLDPLATDLLVVLGGPIGAYEEQKYPCLRDELTSLTRRLAANRPTLGICLGSQLIARALGARVYPMGFKEIGFTPIKLTAEGLHSCLSPFAEDGVVLHWHGDTFDLPDGAMRLAYTKNCANQAFAYGPNTLALQFHPEVSTSNFEQWLIGHACELAGAGISVVDLRSSAQLHAPVIAAKAGAFLKRWLADLT